MAVFATQWTQNYIKVDVLTQAVCSCNYPLPDRTPQNDIANDSLEQFLEHEAMRPRSLKNLNMPSLRGQQILAASPTRTPFR